ncbi:hypothetical protein LY90DRAFT_500718 [Neocallimastix californiae]|uniref:Uncharacterized protein n=1 Tax=Neocallimastix californiae TaxID=1754190 RepID=A0A1Y2F868_9FUNG|nr:hypothetical protein LY90DRAFT_500718 [Neocallimastix californiae]|eukprot:ORY79115.1 hypothetical protein LY90DRAFT_500718 [Neocallimastix californiae]
MINEEILNSKKKRRNKGKEPLEEEEAYIIIVNNTQNMIKEINQLHKRINKTNRDFTNYKYNLKRNSFVINTKTTIEQFNTFKNNYEHDINIIKQDITKLEMKMIQQSCVQEMKIGNLNRTISILQNEIEAIRRGLGGLPTYEESQTNQRNVYGRNNNSFKSLDDIINIDD